MSDAAKRDAVLAVMEEFRMTWVQQSAPGVTCIIAGHDGYAMVAENAALTAAVERVRALHVGWTRTSGDGYCVRCLDTLRALEGTP